MIVAAILYPINKKIRNYVTQPTPVEIKFHDFGKYLDVKEVVVKGKSYHPEEFEMYQCGYPSLASALMISLGIRKRWVEAEAFLDEISVSISGEFAWL